MQKALSLVLVLLAGSALAADGPIPSAPVVAIAQAEVGDVRLVVWETGSGIEAQALDAGTHAPLDGPGLGRMRLGRQLEPGSSNEPGLGALQTRPAVAGMQRDSGEFVFLVAWHAEITDEDGNVQGTEIVGQRVIINSTRNNGTIDPLKRLSRVDDDTNPTAASEARSAPVVVANDREDEFLVLWTHWPNGKSLDADEDSADGYFIYGQEVDAATGDLVGENAARLDLLMAPPDDDTDTPARPDVNPIFLAALPFPDKAGYLLAWSDPAQEDGSDLAQLYTKPVPEDALDILQDERNAVGAASGITKGSGRISLAPMPDGDGYLLAYEDLRGIGPIDAFVLDADGKRADGAFHLLKAMQSGDNAFLSPQLVSVPEENRLLLLAAVGNFSIAGEADETPLQDGRLVLRELDPEALEFSQFGSDFETVAETYPEVNLFFAAQAHAAGALPDGAGAVIFTAVPGASKIAVHEFRFAAEPPPPPPDDDEDEEEEEENGNETPEDGGGGALFGLLFGLALLGRRRRRTARLLGATLAGAFASAAQAGDVTIHAVDQETGARRVYASGSMAHAPVYLGAQTFNMPKLVDACGDVFGLETNVYGEVAIMAAPYEVTHTLDGMRLMATHEYGGIAIGDDHAPYEVSFDETHIRHSSEHISFATPIETQITFDKARLLAIGISGLPDFAFLDDGSLLAINDGMDAARFVAPRKGWGDVKHVVTLMAGLGRERRAVLVTLDAAGNMNIHEPVENAERFVTSMESRPVREAPFPGTRAMVASRSRDIVYRWTDSGDLYAVNVLEGTEKRLGDAGAFKDAFMAITENGLYFVSTAGSFEACPVKAAPVEEVAEAPVDRSVIAAVDELAAFSKAKWEALDNAGRGGIPSFDGEFPDNKATVQTLLEEINGFEKSVVAPLRAKREALFAKYGDESAIVDKIREITGEPYFMPSPIDWTASGLERWDAYKAKIAEALVSNARSDFAIAEVKMMNRGTKDEAAQRYRNAKPWLQWALKFDPENAQAKTMLAKVDTLVADSDKAAVEAVRTAEWPQDRFDFGADTRAMKMKLLRHIQQGHKESARNWAESDYHKGARTFAIRLVRPWYVSRENILQEPTRWTMVVTIATTVPGDPKHARVSQGFIHSTDNKTWNDFLPGTSGYLIPIERVPADDPDMLAKSLELIGK